MESSSNQQRRRSTRIQQQQSQSIQQSIQSQSQPHSATSNAGHHNLYVSDLPTPAPSTSAVSNSGAGAATGPARKGRKRKADEIGEENTIARERSSTRNKADIGQDVQEGSSSAKSRR
ncbi:hypothetical protein BT69DRAFT_385549 [Atractiella rhizophila]|nr:hypothetical protein BT69DRAFT_385549 [Atractiella rhizophila]